VCIDIKLFCFGKVIDVGQCAFRLGPLQSVTEHPVFVLNGLRGSVIYVVDSVESLVEFLVLTFNILVKIGEFHRLEVV